MERETRLNNSTLDTFWDEDSLNRVRCKDVYGDTGTIVGYHKEIELTRGNTKPWFWVIRDRDNALIGIHKEMLEWKEKHK